MSIFFAPKIQHLCGFGIIFSIHKKQRTNTKKTEKAVCLLCLNSVLGSYSSILFTPFLHQFTIEIRGVMWCYVVLTIPNKPSIIQEKLTFVVKYRETWNYSLYFYTELHISSISFCIIVVAGAAIADAVDNTHFPIINNILSSYMRKVNSSF